MLHMVELKHLRAQFRVEEVVDKWTAVPVCCVAAYQSKLTL